MHRLILVGPVLMLALSRCDRGRTDRPAETTLGAARAPAQDTAFGGTIAATDRRRPGAAPTLASAASTLSLPGHDRVVFEFAGDSLPGYHVEYARRPVVKCGSGDPVTVAGEARLLVRFEPASAHDDRGRPSLSPREAAPGLTAVKEMKLVCDFEAQVEWVLGVATVRPYRLTEATRPPRLIVDVSHAP